MEHLHTALENARTIGAAVGIVMAAAKLPEADAFAVLVAASQDANRKVRDIAAEVVDTGLIPGGGREQDPGGVAQTVQASADDSPAARSFPQLRRTQRRIGG